MNIIAWLILGLIAGAIAKLIYPGRQGGGVLAHHWFRNYGCARRGIFR